MNNSSKMKKREDRISALPDEILCHILSLLKTKQAVVTSVLSKRWIPLWRSVSTLNFNLYFNRFVQSVYSVILSRDSCQPIQKFRLSFGRFYQTSYDDNTNIRLWVNTAVQRQVEHINIWLPSVSFLKAPLNLSSIFTCRTLVVLKLKGLELKHFSSVDLPLLKVLHLKSVLLSDLGCLANLLSQCPVLEDLKVNDLYFKKYGNYIEIKTLPKFLRAEISERGTYNLQFRL